MSIPNLKFNTILLVSTVAIGFIFNCLAVFLPQWLMVTMNRRGPGNHEPRKGLGVWPLPSWHEPTYYRVSAGIMIISFCLYALLVGCLAFALVFSKLKKPLLAQIGYGLIVILCVPIFVLELYAATLTYSDFNVDLIGYYPAPGACPSLALISSLCLFLTLPISVFLCRGYNKERKMK